MKFRALLLTLALAGCGTLPEPFYGNPGTEGAKLVTPTAPVLMIPAPGQALLDDKSAALFSQDLAAKLADLDVPSIAGHATKLNWRLITTAKINGTNVTPNYVVQGPDGKTYGTDQGAPIAASAWASGDPAVLEAAAGMDSGTIAKTLADINAKVQQSNPESLRNRVAKLYVSGVSGAPGDGNNALALDIARDLTGNAITVTQDANKADFTVTGIVKTKPETANQILVEIDWIVADATKKQIGQVTQLHDLIPSDISPYWGDVAAAAAQEAATGVAEVVTNHTLHKPNS